MRPDQDLDDVVARTLAPPPAKPGAEQRNQRHRELEDMRWLMGHVQGRRVVWRWLEEAGVFRTSFTGNSVTFFNEGRRAMGLFVLAELMEACPEQYSRMQREHNRKNDDAR